MPQLVVANDALFGDIEVSILTLANDRALMEVLSLARSTMVRTFPTDNISILMTLIAIKIITALAEFKSYKDSKKALKVTKKHFQRVTIVINKFNKYLKEVNQGTDKEKIARRDLDRVVCTPRTRKFKLFTTMDDSSSSDSESLNPSEEEFSGDDPLSSESEKAEKKKENRKEGEKKGKKSKKNKDSDWATEKWRCY